MRKASILLLLFLQSSLILASGEFCPGEPRCTCKWSHGRRTADCKNAGLNSIPTGIDQAYQAIEMDGNPLQNLPSEVFKSANLVNLQTISLKDCHLVEIHPDAFRGLNILQEVTLSKNNLTQIHPKTFEGNDNLRTIKADHNPLFELKPFQFPPLKNLRSLDFSQCSLEKIDRKAFQNLGHGIESIFLNNNNLR